MAIGGALARLRWILTTGIPTLAPVACTEDFASPSLLTGLRVLAVEASPPSGAPGEEVELGLVLDDASPEGTAAVPPRPLEIAWLGACHNPPGGYHVTCDPLLERTASQLSRRVLSTPHGLLPRAAFGVGPAFRVPIPEDILRSRPRDPGDAVHYGVSFAFFAVCAGELRPLLDEDAGVPFQCVKPGSDQVVGDDDYESGFVSIYTFDGIQNQNPVIERTELGGEPILSGACARDEDCEALGSGRLDYRCDRNERCVPAVSACHDADVCDVLEVSPRVSKASVEADPAAAIGGGAAPLEILWVSYFTTSGAVEPATRLVHDRQLGWVADYSAKWTVPTELSESVRLWAVLRDNRGGTAWVKVEVMVR